MNDDILVYLNNEKIFAFEDAKNKNLSKSSLSCAIKHYNKIYFEYLNLYSYDPTVNRQLSELKIAISKLESRANSLDT